MKILFIASRFPYPPLQGDRVRAYNQLRILSERHQITLVAPPEKEAEQNLAAIKPFCHHVELVTPKLWRQLLQMGRAPFTNIPLQTLYCLDPELPAKLNFLVQTEVFDIAHVQLARLGPLADSLGSLPKLLDLIDALSLNMQRRADEERFPKSWVFQLEAKRMARYEQYLTQQYDHLLISSPLDQKIIGDYKNLHVVRNGVDLNRYPFTPTGRDSFSIVFSGRMGYFPNANAAVWFATKIFPLIRQTVPQVTCFIVGADPTPAVKQLAGLPGITVTGYVPQIQDYLTQATLAVAPMLTGSGGQLKVLEALACGTPMVATPFALGGIEAIDGEHLLVAKEAEPFAQHVIRLLKSPTLGQKLAQHGRQLVEKKYSWQYSVEELEKVYQLMV